MQQICVKKIIVLKMFKMQQICIKNILQFSF